MTMRTEKITIRLNETSSFEHTTGWDLTDGGVLTLHKPGGGDIIYSPGGWSRVIVSD